MSIRANRLSVVKKDLGPWWHCASVTYVLTPDQVCFRLKGKIISINLQFSYFSFPGGPDTSRDLGVDRRVIRA